MSHPEVVSRSPQNLDLFITGNDGRVYTSWWYTGSEWSGIADNWRPIGGFFPVGAPIGGVARTPSNLDLFITGNDGRVYTSWWYAGSEWSGIFDNWRAIGGFFPPGAPVSVVARYQNHLDLFITGNDGRVYTSWWHEGSDWSGVADNWAPIGGFFPAGAPVAALSRQPDHLDLFITGNDGRVYTSWWHLGSQWSGAADNWAPIGGFFPAGAPVSAVARRPDHLDLFITGNDGRVYTSWWHDGSSWSGAADNWRSIGGFFPAGARVAALSRQPDHLDLFITGNDGRVYTSWWHEGYEWSGIADNWPQIGGFFPIGEPVGAVDRSPDNLDLFITGNDGRVYTSWWFTGGAWSGVADNWAPIGGFFPVIWPRSTRLAFSMQPQQQFNWCWAAVSTSVDHYYDSASTWTQCSVADGELGRTDCCGTGASGPCNVYGTLDTALRRVGNLDHMDGGIATLDQVKGEINAGRPVGLRVAWSGGGAHFLAIIGYSGDVLGVDDPIYGKSDVRYDVLRTSYQGSGSWTHTYYTKA